MSADVTQYLDSSHLRAFVLPPGCDVDELAAYGGCVWNACCHDVGKCKYLRIANMLDQSERRKGGSCPYKRYYISLMLCMGYMLLYSTRVNLSVAIIYMTEKKMRSVNGTMELRREIDWDEHQQGYALGSFFYGYILTQILGGYLSGVIGGNHVLSIGVIGSALLSFVAPVAAVNSFLALISVRVCCGLLQGLTIPAANAIWAKWAPPFERTVLAGIAISGNFASPLIVMPVCGVIGNHWGWEWMFYFFGILSCVWGLIWIFTVFSAPVKDPYITQKERDFIVEAVGPGSAKPVHPWKRIFGSMAVWAIVVAHFCHNWGYYTVLLFGAKFFKQAGDFSIGLATIWAGLGFFIIAALLDIFCPTIDVIRSRHILSTVAVRKIFTVAGFCIQGAFMTLAAFIPLRTVTVITVILGIGFGGISWAGFYANPLDIAAPHASVISGISNTFATLPGIISPYATVRLISDEDSKISDWFWIWIICSIFYATGAVFFVIFAKGEKQSWVYSPQE